MKRFAWAIPIGLFLFSAAWFAAFLPWNGFIDPDAFYHAKASLLFWQHGPLMAFPWLDLTLLGSHFADLHFLFHAICAPFVAALGLMNGLRVATVLLSAAFVTIFYLVLRWLKMPLSLVWALSLLVSSGLDIRITLGKATPLALMWFVFGLAAIWRRRPWLVALATMGFALSHGGWPYLAGSIVLLALSDVVFERVVHDTPLVASFRRAPWREVGAAFGGVALGLLVHPNRATIVSMAWTQIVTIGLGTPFQHVTLGQEWLPSDFGSLFIACAPMVIMAFLAVAGLAQARRRDLDQMQMRISIGSAIVMAVLFALTIKSRRNIEYLVPVLTLWCASLWSHVDLAAFWHLRKSFVGVMRFVAPTALVVCLFSVLLKEGYSYWHAYHPVGHRDGEYAETMMDIAKRSQPGDRVFHTSWDEFPMLFAQNDQLRYVSGLDPTFLYVASSTLSDAVRDVTTVAKPVTKDAAYHLIHDETKSRFIFASTKGHAAFISLIQHDPRYEEISHHGDSVAYEVKDSP